jgi:uncharacterized membrane protein HdeD (DUF308 family)
MVLSGLAAIMAPRFATYVLAQLLGWLFLFAGVSQLMSAAYLRATEPISSIVIAGLLAGAAGLVMLIHPGLTIAMLTLLLGCFFLAEAIFKGVGAFDIRPHPIWSWLLADGVITGVLALLILGGWPSRSEPVIGLLVGISLLFSGIALTSTALYIRRRT